MKEMREAGSEFDSVIALTSESSKGSVISPTKTSPKGCAIFHQSVTGLIFSSTVYRSRVGYTH